MKWNFIKFSIYIVLNQIKIRIILINFCKFITELWPFIILRIPFFSHNLVNKSMEFIQTPLNILPVNEITLHVLFLLCVLCRGWGWGGGWYLINTAYWNIFFSQKTRFDISCKLSPMETVCMKYQILFSGENEKKKNHQYVVCWISPESAKCKSVWILRENTVPYFMKKIKP